MTYYLLNTNRKLNPSGSDEKTMLRERIAAAYFRGWKEKIKELKHGDIIFLYRAKEGIIAYGVVTGALHIRDYKGEKNEEYYKHLQSFHILQSPISPKMIRNLADGKIAFYKTLIKINEQIGQAILTKFDEEVFVATAA